LGSISAGISSVGQSLDEDIITDDMLSNESFTIPGVLASGEYSFLISSDTCYFIVLLEADCLHIFEF
jgi:hypothetical protein